MIKPRIQVGRPPKMTEDDLAPWADGLLDVIPEKFQYHLGEMDRLSTEYEAERVSITQNHLSGKYDDFALWFWTLWMETKFVYYGAHQKWINYWLDLYDKVPAEKPVIVRTPKPHRDEIDLERLKGDRRIEDFYTDQLRKSGNRLSGRCPFHEEKTPSFFIFDDNHFHCFSCGEHGDVITFIEKTKKMDFKEAVEFLK